MADTLKRTFHGCLTCRKRKVRCLGGSPSCQNCSRMNITCHSSFETNLRIRVSTPTGQKLVDNRPAPPIRGPRRCLPQPPAAAPAPAFDHTHQRQQNETYPSITFEPHFSSFSLSQPPPPPPPPPTAGYGQGQGGGLAVQVPPQYTTTTTPAVVSIPSFDNGLYNWNSSFDFSCVDPSLDPGFGNGFNNGVSAGMVNSSSTMGYGDLMPGLLLPPGFATSAQMPGLVVVSSESDFGGGGGGGGVFLPGGQEGTKEWVPKRRKRSKKVVEKEGEGEGEGGGWSYHRPQPYHLA